MRTTDNVLYLSIQRIYEPLDFQYKTRTIRNISNIL